MTLKEIAKHVKVVSNTFNSNASSSQNYSPTKEPLRKKRKPSDSPNKDLSLGAKNKQKFKKPIILEQGVSVEILVETLVEVILVEQEETLVEQEEISVEISEVEISVEQEEISVVETLEEEISVVETLVEETLEEEISAEETLEEETLEAISVVLNNSQPQLSIARFLMHQTLVLVLSVFMDFIQRTINVRKFLNCVKVTTFKRVNASAASSA